MSKSKEDITPAEYELLIFDIYQKLEKTGIVKHNDYILGRDSGIERQIDISIKSKVVNHEILTIIEAKHYKRKVDLKNIEAFSSVLIDIGASKGIMISNSGFTNSAKQYAFNKKIDLCTIQDAKIKDWHAIMQIPVVKRSINVKMTFRLGFTTKRKTEISQLPFPMDGLIYFLREWENDKVPKSIGKHNYIIDPAIKSLHDDLNLVKHQIEYEISHRYHFKYFIPTDYRGLKDYITNNFTPSFIEINEKIPFLNDGTWEHVENPKNLSIQSDFLDIEMVKLDFFNMLVVRALWQKTHNYIKAV